MALIAKLKFLLPIVLLSLVLFSPTKRYLWASYENVAFIAGINANNIASKSYVNQIKTQNGVYDEVASKAIFLNKIISVDWQKQKQEALAPLPQNILGEESGVNKWIEINLSEQKLYMKEGDKTLASFLISSGRWAPTPTGEFHIWTKLRYARMTGGSPALGTFYDLPNVPYTMYFYQGYGIHGTYWHNNFGHPMSHGCVNMRTEEAAVIYNWADIGTKVVIHS